VQRLEIEAEPVLHIGPEVLDQEVGALDQLEQDRLAPSVFRLSVSERLLRCRFCMS
jgi:hypothetical protein